MNSCQIQMVSIHAPARGATRRYTQLIDAIDDGFNPRAREGRDMGGGIPPREV